MVRNLLSYAASAATAFITLCCPQASAQTVTLAELQGAVIQFSSVVQEKIVRNGEIRYPQLRTQGHLSVGPGDTISVSMQNASGMKSSGVRSGTYTLGKPAKAAMATTSFGCLTTEASFDCACTRGPGRPAVRS